MFLGVNNLSVSYGTNQVLRQVSFSIEKGEIVSVVGPNGSGKSTLVKALLGLIPYSGDVTVDGRPLTRGTQYIGYVPQRFDFDRTFPITVQEFLSLVHDGATKDSEQELVRDLQIDSLLTKRLGELSGGQLQRVLIVQALLSKPHILILDEPTTGIDSAGSQSFYEIIKHLNQEHQMTIILISHETEVVYNVSSRVICLDGDGGLHVESPGIESERELFVKTHHNTKTVKRNHRHT